MNIKDIEIFSKNIKSKIFFNYDLKKTNWFNIGGKTKIFFKVENLKELSEFLKIYKNRSKLFFLGAGSNVLFTDGLFDGVLIKLGNSFSNISLLDNNTIIAGSGTTDRQLSEYAMNNNIGGFEFLSCIPGTVGGGIRMNSGCFNSEFKDILISVQASDVEGNIFTIPSDKIKFDYRNCNLPKNLIFLSATFKGKVKEKILIKEEIDNLKMKKNLSQPTRIKTGGSTFKNPIGQSTKKVWQIIKETVPLSTQFGDAAISEKHCNFFVNKKNAKFEDMKKLINFVKDKVKSKTGINLDLEIILVE